MEINAFDPAAFINSSQSEGVERGLPNSIEEAKTANQPLNENELTESEKKKVEELKARDAEVRRHEQQHKQAAGELAIGNPKYTYETGPDGKQYVVDGEISIDTSPVPNDPEATIQKARRIEKAALAPEEPSEQDRKVAAEARQMALEAQRELMQLQREQTIYGEDGKTQSIAASSLGLNLIA